MVADPMQMLDSMAVQRVRDFIDAGGAALLLLEAIEMNPQTAQTMPIRSGLEPLLEENGIGFTGSMVMDLQSSERVNLGQRGLFSVISPYPLWPITVPGSNHAITSGLNSLTIAWGHSARRSGFHARDSSLDHYGSPGPCRVPWSRSCPTRIGIARRRSSGSTPSPLPSHRPRRDRSGRLVVVGDATFVEGQFLQANASNLKFLANSIDWLAQDEALIRIRSKNRTPPNLVFQSDFERAFLKWGNLIGIPLAFVLFGAIRISGRRRRAEARWGRS